MSRDPVLFRVDATTPAGWERLTRCLAYAGALQRRRRPAYFVSQLDPPALAPALKRAGNTWLPASDPVGTVEDAAMLAKEMLRLRPAAVIIDAPDAPAPYLQQACNAGPLSVIFDTSGNVRLPSSLVINPLLGPGREAYEVAPGTQLLLGRRYAVVRPEIRRLRPLRAQEPPPPFRALVALADYDLQDSIAEFARRLVAVPRLDRLDLVVRAHHPNAARFEELAAAYPARLDVVREPAEVAHRITRCHFAVTNGGSFSLELACIGVPQLLVVQNEMHWPTAQRLEEEGAAICLGSHDNLSMPRVRQAVQELLADAHERQAMARCGRKLIDGRGPDRLVTALEIMLHPSRKARLRAAA